MKDFIGTAAFTWTLNAVFFLFILIAFLIAVRKLKGERQNYVEYAPSFMTSMGLFGTFLGIFIGLLQFDTKHIDTSIEQLLGGLQTAFVTSLMGMFFAIIFKIIQTRHLDKTAPTADGTQPDDISPREIYSVLSKQQNELAIIARGIGGGDERSMIGQLQMLRTDISDFRSGLMKKHESFEAILWKQLSDFADMLSKSATQQVIEALKEVIIDFNEKLTEQFGDNFKRLDESVKKLVDWQANYMNQLDEMTELYAQGVASIGATKLAVESISIETARIPADMRMLGDVMTVNQHQIAELGRHLDSFIMMRDQAVIAVPQIQSKLEEVGQQLMQGAERVNIVLMNGSQQFEDSVKQTNQAMVANAQAIASESESISDEMRNSMELLGLNTERIRSGITSVISSAMESVEENSRTMLNRTQENARSILDSIQQSTQASIELSAQSRNESIRAVDSASKTMVQNADRSLQAVEKQIQEAVNRTNEAVNSQLRQLDEALSRQLNAALQELGSALATIARHLTDAYQRTDQHN